MRSLQLEGALRAFVEDAAALLARDIAAGAEVPFEVVAQGSRGQRTPLYCYQPMPGPFIRERTEQLSRLPSHGPALSALLGAEGLDRYLSARGADRVPAERRERARATLRALLNDVFGEQNEFEVRSDRLTAALQRLEQAAAGGSDQVMVVATLHGLALGSPELALTRGLMLAHPDALRGAPEEASLDTDGGQSHLLAVLGVEGEDAQGTTRHARDVLRELLRALRLFGDGRVTLGELAWSRVGGGSWRPLVLGGGGRPRGMLVVTPEQEDELRAFCNLISRRAPVDNEIAWALERFELGCERVSDQQALTDYLLALRALLEPEGPASGLLPGRLAALCAVPSRRAALAERVAAALDLERRVVAGAQAPQSGGDALVQAIGDHLRALLRDVICGHLDPDLHRVADELLLGESDETAVVAGHQPDLAPPPGGSLWTSAPEPEPEPWGWDRPQGRLLL